MHLICTAHFHPPQVVYIDRPIHSKHRLPPIKWLNKAIAEILKRNGNIPLSNLSKEVGVSPGYFRKKFKEIIGVTPKYYCKVIQLNAIFDAINSDHAERLHLVALDCGYYDQAHFINDFTRFIGNSPERFLKGRFAYVKTYLGRYRV